MSGDEPRVVHLRLLKETASLAECCKAATSLLGSCTSGEGSLCTLHFFSIGRTVGVCKNMAMGQKPVPPGEHPNPH